MLIVKCVPPALELLEERLEVVILNQGERQESSTNPQSHQLISFVLIFFGPVVIFCLRNCSINVDQQNIYKTITYLPLPGC